MADQERNSDTDLELRKLELDAEIRRAELEARRADRESNERIQSAANELRRKELEITGGRGLRFTTAQATVAAALLSLASGVLGGIVQAIMNRDVENRKTDAQIAIEGRRVEAQINVEKLKADSETKLAREKLEFDQKHDLKQFGTYTIQEPTRFNEMNNVLGLSPDPGNEMFGRTDFVIQDGAFNTPNKMVKRINSMALPEIRRIEIWKSGGHTLHVVR